MYAYHQNAFWPIYCCRKGKILFLYYPPHFQHCLTMHTFKRKILINIFQIYWYIIVDQIHTYQILQTDLVWLRMLSWFSKICWPLASGVSFNVLYLIFECVPPPWPNMPFCQKIFLAYSHNISKWHLGSRGGTGSTKQKNAEKFLNSLWKMILAYFRSINCTNVSWL